MASTEDTKFPVFFPVSRELDWEKSSQETASTAIQFPHFSLFLLFLNKHLFWAVLYTLCIDEHDLSFPDFR
jgi:hypothetical protein